MKKYLSLLLVVVLGITVFTACGSEQKTLKVAATSVPHGEMLEFIKPKLEKKGIKLEIVDVQDYNVPNRELSEKGVDANFFQHFSYMNSQIDQFGYEIESLAKIHIEPMGLYSKSITSLDDIKEGATIAVPNDPSNEARALALLHRNGVIELDDVNNEQATIVNIVNNPKNIVVREIEAAMLPRTLEDVDAAVINTNYALEAGMSPMSDAIIMEDADSPFVNIVTIRKGDADREDLKILVEELTSDSMRDFIIDEYKGAVVPVF